MRWCARVAVPTLWAGLLTTPGASAQDAPENPPAVVTAANAPVVYRHLERRIRIERDGRYTESTAVRVMVQHQAVVQASVVLPKTVVPVPAAEVIQVADAKGAITGARPVSATPESTAAARSLIGTRLPIDAPDAVPFRLIGRGALTCVDGRTPCSLILFRISDALQRASSDARVE